MKIHRSFSFPAGSFLWSDWLGGNYDILDIKIIGPPQNRSLIPSYIKWNHYTNHYTRKKTKHKHGELRTYFFVNPTGIVHFFTLPLGNAHKFLSDPLEIPRPKTSEYVLEILHYFFLVTLGNSSSFSVNPWKWQANSLIHLEISYPQPPLFGFFLE